MSAKGVAMDIYESLCDITGSDYVSRQQEEQYIYSRDSGAQPPRRVDFVVMPGSVEEVQRILILANREGISVTPLGGGFTLSALVVPQKGGIVMDMKRMDRILEVNEISRYALIEAGVSQAALRSYLKKHHPRLQHSTPEAPPTVTVTGNALIQGHGHLTPRYGLNSDMVNGMEVVLATGEICKLGSAAVTGSWYTRGPIPDLPGLFIGWFGTTGVVTKLSLKLYPRPQYRNVVVFSSDDVDAIPEVIFELTQLDLLEDFFLITQEKPDWMNHIFYVVILSAHFKEELAMKKRIYREVAGKIGGGKTVKPVDDLHPALRTRFLDVPPKAAVAADFRKGGGFQYSAAILPFNKVPAAWRKGIEIAHAHGMIASYVHQVLTCHSIMFGFNYSFNRADEADIQAARQAVDESNRFTLDIGGMIWKGEAEAQRLVMKKMDPNTARLIEKIKRAMDPKGVMNPGNWELPQ
ncbi:MAG: FAD-binding oxidoreductase [Deltaproteobacteria bacterium]|nr:FAD-binding oxidoreductase [Deltaproteobacteria bacterium]